MKILKSVLTVCFIMMLFVGCVAKVDNEKKEKFVLEFVEGKQVTMSEEEYLGLFFNYTNNSGETVMPDDHVTVNAFQNGVALTPIVYCGQKVEGAVACDTYIQTGKSTEVIWMFELEDKTEISVEVSNGQKFSVKLP